MLRNFVRYFRKFRMEFQVLILILPILFLITLFVGLSLYLQYIEIFSQIKNQSNGLFVNQEYKALSLISAQLHNYIKYKGIFYVSRLEHLNRMFGFMQMNYGNYQNMNNLKRCLKIDEIAKNFLEFDAPQFCYIAFGSEDRISLPQDDKMINIFNQTTQLINQFTITLDATENSIISIIDLTNSVYFAAFPHMYLSIKYLPQQRPWYINHVEKMKTLPEQNYYYSPVFKNYVKNIYQMSISYSISGSSSQKIGIINQNFELNDTNIINTPYNIIVTNENGEVFLQGIESIQNLVYVKDYTLFINDTNKTGFNDSDWQIIKKVALGEETQSRCSNLNSNAFCLYNKYFQKYVIVNSTKIKEGEFYVVIYSNITSQTILNEQLNSINYNISYILTSSLYTLFMSGMFLLLVAILLIHYIFLPLQELMKTLQMLIQSRGNNINKEIFKLFNIKRKKKNSNTFSGLMQAFLKFETKINLSQQSKNQECNYIEQIKYQKQPKSDLIDPLVIDLEIILNDKTNLLQIKNIFDLLKVKIENF